MYIKLRILFKHQTTKQKLLGQSNAKANRFIKLTARHTINPSQEVCNFVDSHDRNFITPLDF